MIPDAEAILIGYLAELPAITKLQAEVVSKTPDDTGPPWVKVNQLNAEDVGASKVDHLIQFVGTFDCYAGKNAGADDGQEVASVLVRTVRAALKDLERIDPAEGVVTSRVRFGGCPRLPDRDLDDMERYQLTVTLRMHT